jgi:lipoprotein-releasing system permease protein
LKFKHLSFNDFRLNLELFIARRLLFAKENKQGISNSVVSIAIIGIALGMAVMILSVAIVTGFKQEIRKKVTGFGAHIIITNYDTNNSYESTPLLKTQSFYPDIENVKGIKHIQTFATKAGIIKTKSDIQGVVLKGVGADFDWQFLEGTVQKGSRFKVEEGKKTDSVLISKHIASLLRLNVGDPLFMYFMDEPIKMRCFKICGIYSTDFLEFDKLYVICDIAQVQKLNEWPENKINGFEIIIDEFDEIDQMKRAVEEAVATKYIQGQEQLQVRSAKDIFPQIFNWLELTNTNVWIILGLMVLVGTFNMISGLFVIILERTSMIGTLKALGAKNFSISKVFLYHAAFLIGKGLLLGNLIGIGLALMQYYFKIVKLNPATYYIDQVPINLQLWHLVLLNVCTLLITTAMLILPSLIISSIKPSKAIKFA